MPKNRSGPDPKITPVMRDTIVHRLGNESDMYRDEIASYVYDRFGEEVSSAGITRAMQREAMTWKGMRRVAQQQRSELRHFYQYKLKRLGCRSYHLIFIDESGTDMRSAYRKKGWAKKGVAPVQKARFQRTKRMQILAAYTQTGVKLARVFPGSTDKATFEDFIDQLLHHCGRFPEPESVLVMDNATFHYSERIEKMCEEAGVKLIFLPPYSPRLNPIEEFFGELKTFIKSQYKRSIGLIRRDFEDYIKRCVKAVGRRQLSAEGHFRRAGHYVEEPPS